MNNINRQDTNPTPGVNIQAEQGNNVQALTTAGQLMNTQTDAIAQQGALPTGEPTNINRADSMAIEINLSPDNLEDNFLDVDSHVSLVQAMARVFDNRFIYHNLDACVKLGDDEFPEYLSRRMIAGSNLNGYAELPPVDSRYEYLLFEIHCDLMENKIPALEELIDGLEENEEVTPILKYNAYLALAESIVWMGTILAGETVEEILAEPLPEERLSGEVGQPFPRTLMDIPLETLNLVDIARRMQRMHRGRT